MFTRSSPSRPFASTLTESQAPKVHLTDHVEDIIPFRSTAHLPPTAAQPHVGPHKKQLQKQAQRAAQAQSSGGGGSSSSEGSDARAKKSPGGVKAKASTKQKKRSSKATERGEEFKEKLEFKAKEQEGRKVSSCTDVRRADMLLEECTDPCSISCNHQMKRDKAKKIWE